MVTLIICIALILILVGIFAAARGRHDDFGFPGWFVALWLVVAAGSLAITIAIIYVAWHFISKFW